jgi:hypothetical protein
MLFMIVAHARGSCPLPPPFYPASLLALFQRIVSLQHPRRNGQPSTLRLIRNAAASAAASPTLLFNDRKNAARLKTDRVRLVALRWHASSSEVRLSVFRLFIFFKVAVCCRKRRRKNSPCMRVTAVAGQWTRKWCVCRVCILKVTVARPLRG